MKDKLRHEEQHFRSFVENSPDIVVLLNLEGIITYINPAVEKVLGFKPEERISAKGFELVHPDDMKLLSDSFNVLASDTNAPIIQGVMRLRHKDGSWRTLEVAGRNLVNNNVVEAIIVNYRDVTDRKKAEDSLRESEDKYKSLIGNVPDIILTIDLEGKITFANQRIKEILGYENEEIINMTIFNFIPEEDYQRAMESLQKGMKGEKIKNFQIPMITKSGGKLFFECSFTRIYKDGAMVGAQGTAVDITERKRAEEIIRESEEKYRMLFDDAQDGIALADAETSLLVDCNHALCRMVERNKQELVGQSQNILHPPEDLIEGVSPTFRKHQIDNPGLVLEDRLMTRGGSLIPIEIRAAKIRINDHNFLLGIFRDITERKRTEEALKQSESWYRTIFENTGTATIIIEEDTTISLVNTEFEKLSGHAKKEIEEKKHWEEFVFHEDLERMLTQHRLRRTDAESAQKTYEFRFVGKDGAVKNIFLRIDMIPGTKKSIASLLDITERNRAEELKKSEQKYRELSIIDDLTQLYNSRHFYTQLEKEMERSNRYQQSLTILLLDLDKFKDYNDTYGHVEGDDVLSRLGQVVKRCLRETDSAYRYGGEEFTIMLPMTTGEEGMIMAQRIQAELRKEAFSPVSGQKIYMTVSIGVAQCKPKEEMKAFVHRVDQLMYQAKKNGRDRICPES